MKSIVEDVIAAYGGIQEVQKRFKYKERMCVYNWRQRGIPSSKIADIHIDTGIDIKKLRKAAA